MACRDRGATWNYRHSATIIENGSRLSPIQTTLHDDQH